MVFHCHNTRASMTSALSETGMDRRVPEGYRKKPKVGGRERSHFPFFVDKCHRSAVDIYLSDSSQEIFSMCALFRYVLNLRRAPWILCLFTDLGSPVSWELSSHIWVSLFCLIVFLGTSAGSAEVINSQYSPKTAAYTQTPKSWTEERPSLGGRYISA